MKPICLHDKTEIEAFFRRDSFLHIYEIGDLDEFFWSYTTWYAIKNNGDIKSVALVYTNCDLPVLVALSDDNRSPMSQLLESLVPFLPRRFDAHLSLGLETIIEDRYESDSRGLHYKMALKDSSLLTRINASEVISLSTSDLDEMRALYRQSYPGNWFDSRMLTTGQYYGIKGPEGLISIAGIHVYSPCYRVAALGNIATHPAHRGKGYAKAVTAKLCQSLS